MGGGDLTMPNLEVVNTIFEFLLSLLVIAGGGYLIAMGYGDSTFLTSMIALVIYFWFQSRSTNSTVNNLLKQIPTLPPQPLTPPQASQPLANDPNTANTQAPTGTGTNI